MPVMMEMMTTTTTWVYAIVFLTELRYGGNKGRFEAHFFGRELNCLRSDDRAETTIFRATLNLVLPYQ